jgi:hypothetical protein
MRNRRALIARVAVLGAIVTAIVVFVSSRAGHTAAGPSLSALTLQGEPDAHVRYPTKAHVTLTAGRRFTTGSDVTARSSGSSSLVFGQPTIAGINGVGFEASLRPDPSDPNRMYESVPGSLSSDTSWIWTTADGGKTWKWVSGSLPLTGKYSMCAGGGDTELGVDSTGSLYFNDLTLANFSTSRSDDHGRTVTCSNAGVPDTAVDRQWYAIDGDPKDGGSIYLVNDEIGPGAVDCPGSTGNNVLVMYRSPVTLGPVDTAGVEFGPANKISGALTCNEGIMGNDEISPVATTKSSTGTPLASPVKHIYVIHDDASFSKILIGRCYPVGVLTDPSGLSCVDLPVADLGDPTKVRTGANFPTMAIDRAGNLYAVWAQSPLDAAGIAGDASLYYSYSTDEGDHWSKPVKIPTGLANNVMPWIAAGDDGRVDIGFYGTSSSVDRVDFGPQGCTQGGPDAVNGFWSIFVTQSLNAHSSTVTFTKPVDASGHPIHHGSIQTVIGHQCGDRTLGDFFQLRVGPNGEAMTSFGDSNNVDEIFAPHAMFVRQVSGSGLDKSKTVSGDAIKKGSVTDPSGDATYDAAGFSSPSMPNLDIVASSVIAPSAASCHPAGQACYRVTMTLSNLSLAAPAAPDTDDVMIWQTQWLVPAKPGCPTGIATCQNGGKNPMVYAESVGGREIQCWVGENSTAVIGGGVALTYPGTTQLTAPGACTMATGPNGKITIDVPKSLVALETGVSPFSSTLYSVTASTLTAPAAPDSVPPLTGFGGVFFDQIDIARGYNAGA